MQLWPVLLWPKPKARQQNEEQNLGISSINLKYNFQTFTLSATAAAVKGKTILMSLLLYVFVINGFLSIARAETNVQKPATGNYGAVDAMSALTGISNGYDAADYMKNYYQVTEPQSEEQQQLQLRQEQEQKQHQTNVIPIASALERTGRPGFEDSSDINSRGFVKRQINNHEHTIVTREAANGGSQARDPLYQTPFTIYNGGFVPTTFTPAGKHYAATFAGLQPGPDNNINAMQQQYAAMAANINNLHENHLLYGNGNNNIMPEIDNSRDQHSLFKRLSNYAAIQDSSGVGSNGGESNINLNPAEEEYDSEGIPDFRQGETQASQADEGGMIQNYALAYADENQQSAMLNNYYNQQPIFSDNHNEPEQSFVNYYAPSSSLEATTSAGYEIENPQNYYTINDYETTTKAPPQHQQQHLQQYKQQTQQQHQQQHEEQYQQQQPHHHHPQQQYTMQYQPPPQSYKQHQQHHHQQLHSQPHQQHHHSHRPTMAPATYFQNFVRHTTNDNREHHHQHRHIAGDNFYTYKQNQIMANYQAKQLKKEKQLKSRQQQQTIPTYQQTEANIHTHHHYQQEPETAETSLSSRIKKSPKNKRKREDTINYSHNYDETNQNNQIEHQDTDSETMHTSGDDLASIQLQQLQNLQQQLLRQQQQYADLQHQLIEHDQQLQIQKHIAQPLTQPTLPPIRHTIQHTPQSLQALSGTPLSKHTQIIKTIPIPQIRQVHVPYRENVSIEVPDPVITVVNKSVPFQIPITRTIAVPKIEEVKIPIEKIKPYPVERPVPYIVEKRVPYTVEKEVAQPVYYPVPIKVPIIHTVIHKVHRRRHAPPSYHLSNTVIRKTHGNGHSFLSPHNFLK